MARHRIPLHTLEIGKPLPWDVFDEYGQLLLCKDYVLTRDSQLTVLEANGLYVDENLLRQSGGGTRKRPEVEPFALWDSVRSELDVLLRGIRLEAEFPRQLDRLASLVQALTRRAPDTALAAMLLGTQKHYAITHSLHVAILCDLVAGRLGWDAPRRRSLVCAAMTMNLAMLDLQMALCTQRIAPTAAQREQIRRHPALATDMLRLAGVQDAVWLRAVAEHHEQPGGNGYPIGIVSPSEDALIVHICDVFSAKLSPRAARPAMTAQEAAKSLLLRGPKQTHLFAAMLIKEVGIFPPGTFVSLANGESGIVWQRGEQANTPLVASLMSASGMRYDKPVQRRTSQKQYEVVSVLPREAIRVQIDVESLWRGH